MSTIAPWVFSTPPTRPRRPQVMLLVFGTGPLRDDVEMSMSRFGAPSAASLAASKVHTVTRAMDSRWFDAWRSGSLRLIAQQDLGASLPALDGADQVHVIACEPDTVEDLTYLQSAWALARCLLERGGGVVLDVHSMTYVPAAQVQPAGAPLDTRREVRVIYETDSKRTDHAHALHTRGLKKFGAPDLVALCTDVDVPLVGHAINELAEQVARGTDLALPRHTVEVAPGVRWVAVDDEHGLSDLLQLNNAARVLVDELGHDLMGVVGRTGAN